MTKQYKYIGSQDIIDNLPEKSARVYVNAAKDILEWIKDSKQSPEYDSCYIATFIISTDSKLWINDRHSEHVLCANGKNVLSAGEITFEVGKNAIEIVAISNQSTGYCPEPDSWASVVIALRNTKIPHPDDFTSKFIFRKCDNCGQKNIVKDDWYFCAVCDAPLSQTWNFYI